MLAAGEKYISLALCKTVVTPVRYCRSLALSHRYDRFIISIVKQFAILCKAKQIIFKSIK